MHRIAQQINNEILKANKIVLVPHIEPDGDALGSVNAMFEYLKNLKKDVKIYSSSPISDSLNFLPHNKKIDFDHKIFLDDEIDLIIALDCGSFKRTKIQEHIKNHSAIIINIDHHHTNEYFGHLNMVIGDASSTTEIIYKFFRYNNISINKNIATSILTGLITDTDNFSNSATTPLSLAVAGEMAQQGANFKKINKYTQQNKTINVFKLWGKVFSRLKKDERLNMAYTYLKLDDFAEIELIDDEKLGINNFLNNLQETKISLVLKELSNNKIKGSFRTTHQDIDVSKMAKTLGGGGHTKAAGFTTEGTLQEVIDKILTIDEKDTIS